jgi:two-component sensor histidine kinase/HAMP domain-containing protein
MSWRFADLPVRTKFMFTLGIPVMGMVLLIGKQVDSNIKRHSVYSYIQGQSERIGLYATVMHEVRRESAFAVARLSGWPVTDHELHKEWARTDSAVAALRAPGPEDMPTVVEESVFNGLGLVRERVAAGTITVPAVIRTYEAMDNAILEELGRLQQLALDPETKDRVYAHLRLLHAKESLSGVHDQLIGRFGNGSTGEEDPTELWEQVSQYETNMVLFERLAPADVMNTYRARFQGPDVNFLRSVIGTVKERGALDQAALNGQDWWALAMGALEKLKDVEDHSLAMIVSNTAENARSARIRLIIVLAALVGVVGAVLVMGVVIMRSLQNTVSGVTRAAQAIAVGDVSAHAPVNSNDEIGQMAISFNEMIDNIRSLASSADAIGKGNYDTVVNVRGPKDVLGIALSRMKENLRAARIRSEEQTLALKEEKARLEQANERIQVLIKEMHHRVKNNLQVIASLLRLQAGSIADERLQYAFDQSQNRVTSMALIHERLYRGDELAMVEVGPYLHELFAELVRLNDVSDRIQYGTDLDDDLAFGLNVMVPLGLLFNELITNSLKHAFVGRNGGRIDLALHRVDADTFDLFYKDDGVGMTVEQQQGSETTLGFSLIESLVEQLNGRMSVSGDATGTRYHIRFKAK